MAVLVFSMGHAICWFVDGILGFSTAPNPGVPCPFPPVSPKPPGLDFTPPPPGGSQIRLAREGRRRSPCFRAQPWHGAGDHRLLPGCPPMRSRAGGLAGRARRRPSGAPRWSAWVLCPGGNACPGRAGWRSDRQTPGAMPGKTLCPGETALPGRLDSSGRRPATEDEGRRGPPLAGARVPTSNTPDVLLGSTGAQRRPDKDTTSAPAS